MTGKTAIVTAVLCAALLVACGTEPVTISISASEPTATPAPTDTPQSQASVEAYAGAEVSLGGGAAPTPTPYVAASQQREGPAPTPVPATQTKEQAASTPTPRAAPKPTSTPTPDPLGEEFFLDILSPAEDTVFVSSPSATVSGRTTLDAVVSINDEVVEVNTDGSFEASVQLQEGPNLVEVVASNTSGEEEAAILTFIYLP